MNGLKGKNLHLKVGDALLIVDIQNDFLPGGSLAVPGGDKIIPVINRYIALFQRKDLPIFATRDLHPPDHCSFQSQGGPWPTHCVAGTRGSEFPQELYLPDSTVLISKAMTVESDAYSGFEGTDLSQQLKYDGIRRIMVGGLATDYCVLNTVQDALRNGLKVFLLQDAVMPVNVQPDDGRMAEEEMIRDGAVPVVFNMIY